ncbi:MAG: hypothetical protein WB608_09615, partial [Terracidiphilus sp.]
FALSMCAPWTETELLSLPVDQELSGHNGAATYGLRFFPEGGREPEIKWIPDVMVPFAKEAIRRVCTITDESRRLAKWLESEPARFFRHKSCPDVDDDQPLTADQAALALGTRSLRQLGLLAVDGAQSLNSLWQWALSRRPNAFPLLRDSLKYSDALFCMTENLLHNGQGSSAVILWVPNINTFNADVRLKAGSSNIFQRWQCTPTLTWSFEKARRLLLEAATQGLPPSSQIAQWASRADPRQNRVYDHRSESEMHTRQSEGSN